MAREGGGLEGGGRGAQRGGLIACVFAGDSICMRRRAAGGGGGRGERFREGNYGIRRSHLAGELRAAWTIIGN